MADILEGYNVSDDVLWDGKITKSIGGGANNEKSNADSQVYGWAKYPDMIAEAAD